MHSSDSAVETIKNNMKLYTHLDRIYRELAELGLSTGAPTENEQVQGPPLDIHVVNEIDSLHYLGNEAMESAVEKAGINETSNVLDVGSGLGGPARYLAHRTHCRIAAMELQPDLSQIASDLTRRCQLSHLVKHVTQDFLHSSATQPSFTTIVSWLVFLHIGDRSTLFQKCYDCLQSNGGLLYVEDFACRQGRQFTPREIHLLQTEVSVHHELPTWNEIRGTLLEKGFHIVGIIDMTDRWTEYVCQRYAAYVASRNRHERVHGKENYEALLTFYLAVKTLFQGGNLQGIKYIARKD